MNESGDNDRSKDDIEMQSKPSIDTDKVNSAAAEGSSKKAVKSSKVESDNPPAPPLRDYNAENQPMSSSNEAYSKVNKAKRIGSFLRPEVIYKPEVSETWMTCLKNTLILLNLLIWLLGAVITALGIWVKLDREFWDIQTGLDIKQFSTAGYIMIAVGVIIMLVGFIGCYGAFASKLWLLVTFIIIVVIVIFMEIAAIAIVWTASNNKEVKEDIKLRAKLALKNMKESDSKRYLIDLLQAKLHCCGVDGPGDFAIDDSNAPVIELSPIPKSCINSETGSTFPQGCFDAVMNYFKSKASILGGTAIAVFVLQLGALILTICVACGLKQAATSSIF